ncbi:hypothetical protein Gohar_021569 [Gossypium harknessii]|uniref:Uncharacterized protein n=1 Tax=Gossypium harknessii TaxID=34285 RepID=A0A7J9I779_9ROSI|nr:hypothetical protein [Gossypium harknessii]
MDRNSSESAKGGHRVESSMTTSG